MATVYVLLAPSIDKFYVGSCFDLKVRLEQHQSNAFQTAFTHRANEWEVFYSFENLEVNLARKIESHIKKMKSRIYYENLKKHPEIIQKLILKYEAGSSRISR